MDCGTAGTIPLRWTLSVLFYRSYLEASTVFLLLPSAYIIAVIRTISVCNLVFILAFRIILQRSHLVTEGNRHYVGNAKSDQETSGLLVGFGPVSREGIEPTT